MDPDEFESPVSRPNGAGPSPSSASIGRNPTPRQGGRYGTPPRETVIKHCHHVYRAACDASLRYSVTAAAPFRGLSLTDSVLLAILQVAFGSAGKATSKGKSGLASASRPPVSRLNSAVDTDADSVSVTESDDVSVMTEDDYGPQEGDSVQVRPLVVQSDTYLQCPAVFHWPVPLRTCL